MPVTQPNPRAFDYFYKIALEYYVSARAALLCGNSLVIGNLLHHAVEMLLKGQLSKTIALKELKDKFQHKLPILWTAFKELFATHDLAEFDSMIRELEKFESIRYPDKILEDGACIIFGFGRGIATANMASDRTEPEYQMGLGDVDAFFSRLFPLCRLNPKAYFCSLSPDGRRALDDGNAESKDWLP